MTIAIAGTSDIVMMLSIVDVAGLNKISKTIFRNALLAVAGIKLHAAIDVQIHHNYIHNCTLGTWLDWQAQGTRVSSNIYDRNDRDLMVEVTHGPYHLPHSTEILGTVPVYGFDDRWYQNIFVGGKEENRSYGTALYNGAPVSLEEYTERVRALGNGDVEQFERVKQQACINGNVYLNGADVFDRERDYVKSDMDPEVKVVEEGSVVYLEITLPQEALAVPAELITTGILGMVRIVEQRYENPDGTALVLDKDLTGETRAEQPKAGPVEAIHEGKNRIRIWKKGLRY